MEPAQQFFNKVSHLCHEMPPAATERLVDELEKAFHAGRQVFIFGNGGSGANASHFCEDLAKYPLRSMEDRKRFKVMSLTDNTPWILALANDCGYETIFEQQLRHYAQPGDVAIGISGSGNSANVLNAIRYANEVGMVTFGMTGFDGGELRTLAQHAVHVPIHDMGIVECMHLIIAHYVIYELGERVGEAG
jgi:D-sedoheptulose 7-phosphate isomerase